MATSLQDTSSPALGALAAATLLASLGISIVTVTLPTLAQAFSAPVDAVQWVVLAYLVSITVTIVLAGRLGDMHGHRRVLLAGLALFGLASLLCAAAPTLGVLIAGRAVQGVGGAILMALPLSMAREVVGQARTGSAMGLFATMSALGTALGPSLGGLLIEGVGWRAAFVLLGGLGAGVGLLVAWAVPVATRQAAPGPLLSLAPLRDGQLRRLLMMNLLLSTVMMTTLVVGPFFLTFGLGLKVALTGLVMAVGPLVAALSGVPAGRLVDRLGARRALLLGLVQTIVGLVCLASLPRGLGVAGYVLGLVLLTPGFQLFLTANNTAVMLGAADAQRGVLSGLLGLSRNLGFMAGASLMPWLFSVALGSREVAHAGSGQVAAAFSLTFLVAAGLVVVAVGLAGWGGFRRKTAGSWGY
ncbi:MFS transporter [Pseudomonas entomophila]|uniref:MFS transporter n=1 Tax=Pseudomonas entomophila TaxID=312306 RepID=UPI0023D8225C|nr:MFS transporter [Pseudomonas entomophila]MDF0729392.1 MFS transporter [Pseudomonas entomophila]